MAASYNFPNPKDPSDVADYTFDWSQALPSTTIVSSNWIVIGVTNVSSSIIGKNTIIRLSGGNPNTIASLTNTITDSSGQIFERSANLTIKNL